MAVVILPGCGDDDDVTSLNGDGMFKPMPLAEGNYWVYSTEAFIADSLTSSTIDTFRINRIINRFEFPYNNITWYGDKDENIYYRNAVEGIWILDLSGESSEEPRLVYPYPVSENQSWIEIVGQDTVTYTVVSISDTVIVPTGQFSGCFHIRGTNTGSEYTYDEWFKPEVGVVRGLYTAPLPGSEGIRIRNIKKLRDYLLR